MKRRAHIFALVILLFCVALLVACGKRREKPTLSPSDAHTQVFDSVMTLIGKGAITSEAEFDSTRNSLSASIIWKVRSDGLQGESRLRYAQLLLWSGSREKARRIFEDIRTCKDKYASESWKELITMDIEAERYANAEASMKEYRVTFPPDTSDLKYLFSPCVLLCDRYSEANRPDAAIRVCEDELNAMPADAPYQSFYVGSSIVPLIMETGRVAEGRAILDACRTKLQASLALHEKAAAASSADSAEKTIAEGLKALVDCYSSLLSQLDLAGKKAPAFKFLRVYNADSTLTLDALHGKVVMIDFWATWCLPCVVGYAEAHRIYQDYKDKGLEILGITSFQGAYRDRDTGATEGTKDEPLSTKREIELTGAYIRKHGMTWPCAISDRPVFDPSYKITAVPTFVLIDRNGIIRFIQTGMGQEKQKRRIIDKLMRG